jgi:DNA helicase-2/ATP-dependent DNA helicase PcrA
MDFLSGLNPQQREAVQHVHGPLLILAGAGSGKTRVITHRISHLIHAHGVYGPAILAVTFTNKAAGEMRDRVFQLLARSPAADGPNVSTFHSFCVRLLRRDGAGLAQVRPGFTTSFNIYGDDDQLVLIKQVFKRLGLDDKFMQPRAALARISQGKNQKQGPADFAKNAADPKMSKLAVVFEHYQQGLEKVNALDFDDLLLESVRLLRLDGGTRELWNRRIEHLMIDEYQDTNRPQYELMRLLAGANRNVAVVGDEDQSIYGWRGADIRNILDFERDFPGARVVRLETNYRSTRTIVAAASAVVGNNKARLEKTLRSNGEEGLPVTCFEAADGEQEAVMIAETVEKLIRSDPSVKIAILYRTNFQSRQIEEALRRYGRNYLVVGGFSFYQRAEVKDALAYLRLLLDTRDNIGLLRILNVPARGIGQTTVAQLDRIAAERGLSLYDAIAAACDGHLFGARAEASLSAFRRLIEELRQLAAVQSPGQLLRDVLEKSGYRQMLAGDGTIDSESRLANLEELISAAADAAERGEGLREFLDSAALVSDADQVDEEAQVSLLTMHNAKGLEFPVVFITGMEEGIFPHSRSRDSEAQLEEERRLCYVAMTRAMRRLYVSSARFRRKYGGAPPELCTPSRFLHEIPRQYLENLTEDRRTPGSVDLYGERQMVREAARKNTYTGKTYNSLDHISQFFAERGIQPPAPSTAASPHVRSSPAPPQAASKPTPAVKPPAAKPPRQPGGIRAGAGVVHPKYGRGIVLRREGEGDDAKLTISFPGHGLKKLLARFAGLTSEE